MARTVSLTMTNGSSARSASRARAMSCSRLARRSSCWFSAPAVAGGLDGEPASVKGTSVIRAVEVRHAAHAGQQRRRIAVEATVDLDGLARGVDLAGDAHDAGIVGPAGFRHLHAGMGAGLQPSQP